MARKRRRWPDEFRANAVLLLEAAGYPDKKGALAQTANHLKVPNTTLRGWFLDKHNPPPAELRTEKRAELTELLRTEIDAIFAVMPGARPDADYKTLGTVAGILIDKMQLLTGQPTENANTKIVIEYADTNPDAPETT